MDAGGKTRGSSNANKPNSAYVPHNRLSRYLAALSSLALVKFKSALGSELPLDKIGLFSSASFRWLNEYLYAGYKNGMKDKTLPSLSHRETCNVNGPRLEGLLHAQFVERGQAGASMVVVAWQFVRTRLIVGSVVHLLGTLVSLAGPIFVLSEIIRATQDRNALNLAAGTPNRTAGASSNASDVTRSRSKEIMIDELVIFSHIGLLIAVEIVAQFLIAWSSSLNLRTACRLRSACLAVAYKKLLRSSLRCSTAAQQTLTYFVPDSETLHELIGMGPLALSGPAVLLIVSAYTWYTLGRWALLGIIVIVLLYCCMIIAAYFNKAFAARAIEYSVRRMSLVEEFINNIQLAKITQWDRYFQDKIRDIRNRELAEMQFGNFSEGCGLSMVHTIPIFTVSTVTLFAIALEKQVSLAECVPVLVLFLINLKQCIRASWTALSSISRGLAFLNKLKAILILQETERYLDKPIDRNFAVIVRNGHFTWAKSKPLAGQASKRASRFYVDGQQGNAVDFDFPSTDVSTISGIEFYVPKGKLVGVCGPQDSGKTSFLMSILGHLQCVGGTVAIDGTLAYVPAEPWLMDGTVKENVLFGESYDSSRYYQAIRSSNLHSEMPRLAELDDTEVSAADLGPVLRQKIGLARLVYAQRDINLLDEPLADLSYKERLEVFDKCVVQRLAGKTVIVATDKIELLSQCHVIYMMRDGKIVENGKHEELNQSSSEYAELVKQQIGRHQRLLRSGDLTSASPSRMTPSSPKDFSSSIAALSLDSIDTRSDDSRPLYGRAFEFPTLRALNESRPKSGTRVYLRYAGGWPVVGLLCLLVALYAFCVAVAPVCIVHVGLRAADLRLAVGVLATLVGLLVVAGALLTAAYNKTTIGAASKLHEHWIESLGRARISVFSSATISLLLNICSLNLQEVDSVLPRAAIAVLVNVAVSLFSLAILGALCAWLLVPALGFVLAAALFGAYVRGAVLGLHELKVSSATLVLDHIGHTVRGRATIQAFAKEKDFAKRYYRLFNENSTYDLMLYASRLWTEFRLKALSALVLGAAVLGSELGCAGGEGLARLGLAYVCALQLTLSALHAAGALGSVYTSLVALSSVHHYVKSVPKEREGTARLSSLWPIDGSVEFRRVCLLDREESSWRPLSFSVLAGESIAVVTSRADAKLALVSALFRFTELPAGEILVGGTSIGQVPLDTLRRCLCFVPGEPQLFHGSIRHNLDPAERHADQSLMKVLQKVYLWEKVSKLPDKLMSDACHLFTATERVMLYLARALLSEHTKIVVMEEPLLDERDEHRDVLELVLATAFDGHTLIRLSSCRIRSCPRFLALDDELEDFNSDQNSSTLSQLTLTTDLYSAAMPALSSVGQSNNAHLSRFNGAPPNDIYTLVPMNLLADSYSTD
ncbi:ATP-binding cassette sub-family C member 12-like isoform X2 [Phymastichus coffea]|uniref:ATP-binding cassette sub-family C member 12-like isoform X2 n=1 Tax=Phymastichus coffea TaxID=108790 RepID=UPI00273C79A9|nr:ATP-binding cassette sub-family C member 12-like isoform X2 [Phymastichus coffea]